MMFQLLKRDKDGNLITNTKGLIKLYDETYDECLGQGDIYPELNELKQLNSLLFELRQKLAKSKVTPEWSHKQLIYKK